MKRGAAPLRFVWRQTAELWRVRTEDVGGFDRTPALLQITAPRRLQMLDSVVFQENCESFASEPMKGEDAR